MICPYKSLQPTQKQLRGSRSARRQSCDTHKGRIKDRPIDDGSKQYFATIYPVGDPWQQPYSRVLFSRFLHSDGDCAIRVFMDTYQDGKKAERVWTNPCWKGGGPLRSSVGLSVCHVASLLCGGPR